MTIMKQIKTVIILAITINIIFTCYSTARSINIGKVNLQALILLHPAMIGYDPVKQAFRLDNSTLNKNLLESQLRERKAQITILNKKLSKLNSDLVAIHKRYEKKLSKLSERYLTNLEKLATGVAALKKTKYNLESQKIETHYKSSLVTIYAKIRNTQQKIKRLNRLADCTGYTSPEETDKKMKAILSEIKRYTKQIASSKGINIVLNSSNYHFNSNNHPTTSSIPPDLTYGKIFITKFPKELLSDNAAVTGYYANIQSIAYNWLTHGNDLLKPYAAMLKNTDIFIGGVDLTVDVLKALFRAYKIDKNLGNTIIQTLQTFN